MDVEFSISLQNFGVNNKTKDTCFAWADGLSFPQFIKCVY